MNMNNKSSLNETSPTEILLKSIPIKELLKSPDFIYAFLCTVALILIIYVFGVHSSNENFLMEISEMIDTNAININSALLGIIIAAVAIVTAFSKPELLSKLYFYKKDEKRLHQYLLVLIYPAIPAIIGIILAFIGNIFIILKYAYLYISISTLVFFFTFYCIFGVWESVKQIANSIVTLARQNKV